MIDRFERFSLPKTVDEAVDVLVSDLTTQQMDTMGQMTDEQFDAMCCQLMPHLDHDFRLWSGNDQLLMDCLESLDDATGADPRRVIMDRMRERLKTDHVIYIVI